MLGHRKFDDYIKARFLTAQLFVGMTTTSGTSYHCANFNNIFFQVCSINDFFSSSSLILLILFILFYKVKRKEEMDFCFPTI